MSSTILACFAWARNYLCRVKIFNYKRDKQLLVECQNLRTIICLLLISRHFGRVVWLDCCDNNNRIMEIFHVNKKRKAIFFVVEQNFFPFWCCCVRFSFFLLIVRLRHCVTPGYFYFSTVVFEYINFVLETKDRFFGQK